MKQPGKLGVKKSKKKSSTDLSQYIDHTLLKPDATFTELEKLCQEAKQHYFKGVCVNACNIEFISNQLKGSDTLPVAVVGFPLGASTSKTKAFEAKNAVLHGAQEIDMVINIGALKSKDYQTVVTDIEQVVEASKPFKVKVIIEAAMLNDEEKIIACALSKGAGAHFVKTSTGFGPGGATIKDVELMRRIVGKDMGVKASGGIKTLQDVKAMINAGANRIGCSSSVMIVNS